MISPQGEIGLKPMLGCNGQTHLKAGISFGLMILDQESTIIKTYVLNS
jgi:hypothetical protein